MRLVVPPPAGARPATHPRGTLYELADGAGRLLLSPLFPFPIEPDAWIARALVEDAPPGTRPENLVSLPLRAVDGWDATLVEARVGAELRLVVLYRFLDYGAAAIARFDGAAGAQRDATLNALQHGRPEFPRDGTACLAELFEGVTGEAPAADAGDALAGTHRWLSGGDSVFELPEGPAAGHVRVHARTPLRPLHAIVAEIFQQTPGARLIAPRGLTTAEGEYAAVFGVATATQERAVGFVVGDEHMSVIDGVARLPERFALVRRAVVEAARATCLGLGADRRRWYFYAPPPGWTGIRRAHATEWLPPDVGASRATLTVLDARPARPTRAELAHRRTFDGLPAYLADVPPSPPVPVVAGGGARGEIVVRAAAPLARADATVRDGRWLYELRLACRADDVERFRPAIELAAASVRPLPPG
jgi:hypothetical protein